MPRLAPRLAPGVALGLALGLALPGRPAAAAPGDDVGAARLPAGRARLAVVDDRSLAASTLGAPWSLAVDAAVGVTPRLTLGLGHSAGALGRVHGGQGLCRDSAAHVCDAWYAGGYLDARWALPGTAALDLLARLGLDSVAPWKPVARLGLARRGGRGRWWWGGQVELAVGLAARDRGNRDRLFAPVWLGRDLSPVALWFETGARGPLDAFAETVEIRAVLGAAVHLRHATLGLRAGFPQLLGPQNSGRLRDLETWLAWTW